MGRTSSDPPRPPATVTAVTVLDELAGQVARRQVARQRRGDLEQRLIDLGLEARGHRHVAQRPHQDGGGGDDRTEQDRQPGLQAHVSPPAWCIPTPRTDLISVSPGTSSLRRRYPMNTARFLVSGPKS